MNFLKRFFKPTIPADSQMFTVQKVYCETDSIWLCKKKAMDHVSKLNKAMEDHGNSTRFECSRLPHRLLDRPKP